MRIRQESNILQKKSTEVRDNYMTIMEIVLSLYSTGITAVAVVSFYRRPAVRSRFSDEEQGVIAHTLANGVSTRRTLSEYVPYSGARIDIAVASLLAQEILTETADGGLLSYRVSEGSDIFALRE